MPRSLTHHNEADENGRSTKLRPGRTRRVDTSPRRITGTARNLLRLTRLVSRSSRASSSKNSVIQGVGKGSPFQRRAIVNVRYSNARTPGGWKAHGTYIERESARRVAQPADRSQETATEERADGDDRLGLARERSLSSLAGSWQGAGDQRLFKIIISPEDANINFGRTSEEVIARIEQHTGTRVAWAGVVHRNTDHPHAHLIVRGRHPSGEALHLPPTLIRSTLREAAQASITRQLGPRTIEDIQRQKHVELTANRVTPLDREMVGRASTYSAEQAFISLSQPYSAPTLARLGHLQQMGLAKPLVNRSGCDSWLLRSDLLAQLQQMKDIQDRARTLFQSGVAISDPQAPMTFSTRSKKLIGRVLLNSEDERTGALQTIFETTDGKIEVIRHDGTLRAAWRRGDLTPGNIVTIDSLRSDPSKLYAASVGPDHEVLANPKALDSVARRLRTMSLQLGASEKGWMGEFNHLLRQRLKERVRGQEL